MAHNWISVLFVKVFYRVVRLEYNSLFFIWIELGFNRIQNLNLKLVLIFGFNWIYFLFFSLNLNKITIFWAKVFHNKPIKKSISWLRQMAFQLSYAQRIAFHLFILCSEIIYYPVFHNKSFISMKRYFSFGKEIKIFE